MQLQCAHGIRREGHTPARIPPKSILSTLPKKQSLLIQAMSIAPWGLIMYFWVTCINMNCQPVLGKGALSKQLSHPNGGQKTICFFKLLTKLLPGPALRAAGLGGGRGGRGLEREPQRCSLLSRPGHPCLKWLLWETEGDCLLQTLDSGACSEVGEASLQTCEQPGRAHLTVPVPDLGPASPRP